MTDDLSETIDSVASNPAEVETEAGHVVAQPLSELIEADKYLASKDAAKQVHRGVRFTKLVPPGTV